MQPYEIEIFSSFSLRAVCRALAPDMELNMDAVLDFMNYPHRYFSHFPGCLEKFNAPRCIVNYWKWSNTIIRFVANEQRVKYLSNWRYKLFTACTAAGTASYVLRDLCRELGGSHEEPLDDVCFPFPHIQEKYAKQNLTKHIVMFHEFMDWCIKLALDSNHLAADWHPKLEIIIVIRISCLTHHTVTLQDMWKCDESHEYYVWIGTYTCLHEHVVSCCCRVSPAFTWPRHWGFRIAWIKFLTTCCHIT